MSQTSDKETLRLLSEEVRPLLLKRVIEEIPLTQLTPGFYSRLFVVPKKTGGMKPVIGLSILNSYKLGYGNKHPKGPVWWSIDLEKYKI
jgi:hypothetical protein